jgi:drug/metabolite transporter (DMT)-like permease
LNNNTYKAHFALLSANIIFGVNHIIAKGIMPDKIRPSAFIFIRIIGAGILFWMLKFYIKEKIEKKDILRLILCGLLGVAINQMFFFHGLNLTSPIDASIIITAIPVMVLIFSALFLNEKITTNKAIGITIGGLGAFLLIWYGKKSGGTSSVLGNLFVFINACSYALYLVVAKPLMKKYNPITVISWVFLFGLIFVFPMGLPDFLNTNFAEFTVNTYLTVAFVVFATTFLAYLFNIYALSYVSPAINGSYIYLQPVVSFIMVIIYAYLLGATQYKQDINGIKIISCLLVIAGVYMISKEQNKKLA